MSGGAKKLTPAELEDEQLTADMDWFDAQGVKPENDQSGPPAPANDNSDPAAAADMAWFEKQGAAAPSGAESPAPSFLDYKAPEPAAPEQDILQRFLQSSEAGATDAATSVRSQMQRMGHDASEGATDAASAIKPLVRGLGGVGPDPDTLSADQAGARAARERSPYATGAARAALSVPGAGVLGPAAAGAVQGGLDTAAEGGSDRDSLLSALVGGAVGKGSELVGKGMQAVQEAAPAVGERLNTLASRARVAASGIYGGAYKRLANEIGDEGVTKLGNDIERLGLHEKPGSMLAQPPETYLNNARSLADRESVNQNILAHDATNEGVSVPTGHIADQLEGRALSNDAEFIPKGASEANYQRGIADSIRTKSAATAQFDPETGEPLAGDYQLPFDSALKRRQYVDKAVTDYGKQAPGMTPTYENETNRYVANQLRGGLQDSLDEQAPHLAEPWRNTNANLSTALTVQHPAEARVFQEAGNQRVSLPTWMAAASGGAAGGPVGSAAAMTAAALAKSRGQAAYAGGLRGMQGLAEGVGNDADIEMLSKFLQGPGAGVAAGGIATSRPQQAAADSGGNTSDNRLDAQKNAVADGRGDLLPDAVNDVLVSDPEKLGRWRGQFEQAGRTPGGVAALLQKLRSTDTEWRTQKLPELQYMTQGAQ